MHDQSVTYSHRLLFCTGGRDVDVLSEAAGKGRGLAFLLQRLKEVGCAPENVQVRERERQRQCACSDGVSAILFCLLQRLKEAGCAPEHVQASVRAVLLFCGFLSFFLLNCVCCKVQGEVVCIKLVIL